MGKSLLSDRNLRLLGIPLIGFLVPVFIHPDEFFEFGTVFRNRLILFLSTAFLLLEGDRRIFLAFRRRYLLFGQTTQRLIIQAITVVAYTLLVSVFVNYVLCRKVLNFYQGDTLMTDFYISLIPTTIITLCYESVYFFQDWKANVQKAEKLARISLESQLAVLKSQLDPHFLFNSLNSLAAMIDDNETASIYLDPLADVYRYREISLVSLDEEMRILDACIYLNKTRFRENLQVEKQLITNVPGRRIAPMRLQLLVENAIKHNVVSKEKPLIIKTVEEGSDYLVISNNIQAKTTLENLRERYRLLTSQTIEITNDGVQFRIRIPLINV